MTTDADGKKAEVNQATIDRARAAAGFKGYVTNIGVEVMDGAQVVAAYHDLWHVEESFRMAKSDLQARPIFHHKKRFDRGPPHDRVHRSRGRRYSKTAPGSRSKKLVQALRPLQSVTITLAGQQITAQPRLTPDAATILATIPDLAGH